LAVIEAAVAQAAGDEVPSGGPLRQPGGLEELLPRGGLDMHRTRPEPDQTSALPTPLAPERCAAWPPPNRHGVRLQEDSKTALMIGYARVSTDEQDLTAQQDGPASLGVAPERIYVDHGLTGTNRERPGLREAMAACRDGDTLVVTKLDRLARSLPARSSTTSPAGRSSSASAAPCTTRPTRLAARCSTSAYGSSPSPPSTLRATSDLPVTPKIL